MSAIEAQHRRGSSGASGSPTPLDGVQWPVAMLITAYGVSFGIRASAPDLTEGLTDYLPPGSKYEEFADAERVYSLLYREGDPRFRQRFWVYRGRGLLARCSTQKDALGAIETDVQLYVAEMAPEHVFVHAGVIGLQGRVILLPGRSRAGKSTLVRELVRAGADYFSDEYAVLDSMGEVLPYARLLSVREAMSGPPLIKQSVQSLGGRIGSGPLPVGVVVMTEFQPAGQWNPQRLSPGAGALALLSNTVPARRIPDVVMSTLRKVVAHAPVVASERGEAAQVVDLILDLTKRT